MKGTIKSRKPFWMLSATYYSNRKYQRGGASFYMKYGFESSFKNASGMHGSLMINYGKWSKWEMQINSNYL